MDITSVSIGLFIFILFMAPIIYLLMSASLKTSKKKKLLKKIAQDQQLELDHLEFYEHCILGLDSEKKQLLIVENSEKYDVILLKNVKDSYVSKKLISDHYKDRKKEHIVHLSLELINNLNEKITAIVFYDEESEEALDAEAQLFMAQKWDKLIHHNLGA